METDETISAADVPALVARYHRPLVMYAAHRLGDANAEDAVQEMWLRLWRVLQGEYAVPASAMQAWLYRVLSRLVIDDLRHRRPQMWLPLTALGSLEPLATEWEAETLRRLEARRLLSRLHAQGRALLLWRAAGYSYQEICTHAHLSQSAAKEIVYRARLALDAWREREAS